MSEHNIRERIAGIMRTKVGSNFEYDALTDKCSEVVAPMLDDLISALGMMVELHDAAGMPNGRIRRHAESILQQWPDA